MTRSDDRFTEAETRAYADWQAEQLRGNPPSNQNGARPDGAQRPTYTLDDTGNAARFAALFGERYRYNHTLKRWLRWDGVRWATDDTGQAQEDAKRVAEMVFSDALDMPDGSRQRSDTLAWARSSGMGHHIAKTLSLASSIPPIAVVASDLDANPMLVAFRNGYLDLETDVFVAPYPGALVTMVCAADYDMDAVDTLWEATKDLFLPDAAIRQDFFTAMGYCLTGRTKEHLFMPYGGTKRGKSTTVMAVVTALGDYAETVEMETFTTGNYHSAGGAREDLVALIGKRLVVANEASEQTRLSATTLKRLMGGSDKMSLRANYGRQFTALPRFSLWLLTNHPPKLPADDEAVWERLHVFPFDHFIPPEQRDEALRDRVVHTTSTAVMADVVRGWRRYRDEQRQRLSLPTTVLATKSYQQEQDHLAAWIDERCVEGDACWISFASLKADFADWRKDNDVSEEYSDRRLALALDKRYPSAKHPQLKTRCRRGLALRGTDGANGRCPWSDPIQRVAAE